MASQILLNPIGSGGDVFPFLALGRELQKRGHHVAVMTNPTFQENVGQAGLEFIEIGTTDSLRAAGKDPRLHQPANAWKLAIKWGAVGTMRQTFETIRERIQMCDTMLIAPCIGFGSRMAAERLNLPLATIVLSPFLIRSVHQSPVMKPMVLGDWVPKVTKKLQFWFADRFVIDPIIKSDVAQLRKEIRLPPCSRFLHRWCFSNDLILGLFPEVFAPVQPDWPSNTRCFGHIKWDPPVDPQTEIAINQFVNSGSKPIILQAGSAGPESSEFYRNWIQATHQLDRQLILLEKNHRLVPADLPDHVFHARYFPIEPLLTQSALIAHSGGVGATLRSLAAGLPQLLFPKVNDQPDNAARVRRLGVGKIIRSKHPTADQIANAITDVVSSRAIHENCERIKHALPDADPIQESCDLIEAAFARYRN